MDKDELLELAWGLICNASNRPIEAGPVDALPGWSEAGVRFRTGYIQLLERTPK